MVLIPRVVLISSDLYSESLLCINVTDARVDITGFNLKQLISDNLRTNKTNGLHLPFYRYQGGLTTPPCLEVVTWTVMRNPVYITAEQVHHIS